MILFSRVSFCLATKATVLVKVLEPRDCRPLLESCLLKCPIARHTQYDRHIQNIDRVNEAKLRSPDCNWGEEASGVSH